MKFVRVYIYIYVYISRTKETTPRPCPVTKQGDRAVFFLLLFFFLFKHLFSVSSPTVYVNFWVVIGRRYAHMMIDGYPFRFKGFLGDKQLIQSINRYSYTYHSYATRLLLQLVISYNISERFLKWKTKDTRNPSYKSRVGPSFRQSSIIISIRNW